MCVGKEKEGVYVCVGSWVLQSPHNSEDNGTESLDWKIILEGLERQKWGGRLLQMVTSSVIATRYVYMCGNTILCHAGRTAWVTAPFLCQKINWREARGEPMFSPSVYLPMAFQSQRCQLLQGWWSCSKITVSLVNLPLVMWQFFWLLKRSSSIINAHHTSAKACNSSEKVQCFSLWKRTSSSECKIVCSLKLKDRRTCWYNCLHPVHHGD